MLYGLQNSLHLRTGIQGVLAIRLDFNLSKPLPYLKWASLSQDRSGPRDYSSAEFVDSSDFLSAVTASTLLFNYATKSTPLDLGVNVLWLASLVFSLASAINSQLSYQWHSATYRGPHLYLPV